MLRRYTLTELSDATGLSRWMLRQWVVSGWLKASAITHGGRRLYSEADFTEAEKASRETIKPCPPARIDFSYIK